MSNSVSGSSTRKRPELEQSISLEDTGDRLECVTKQRVKGPAGRRLPRQRSPQVDGDNEQDDDEQVSIIRRSGSLTRIDSPKRLESASSSPPVHDTVHNQTSQLTCTADQNRSGSLWTFCVLQ